MMVGGVRPALTFTIGSAKACVSRGEVAMRAVSRALLNRALESAASPMFLCDQTGTLCWVNQACCAYYGWSRRELLGQRPAVFRSGQHPAALYRDLWQRIQSGQPWQGEFVNRRRDGSLCHVQTVITPLIGADGRIAHFLAVQQDVAHHELERETMRDLAFHDSLTGLPNRRLFYQRLEAAMSESDATGEGFALLFVDLDDFKGINDRLGHEAGDQLLRLVAERLQATVRSYDLVARLGGDEMTVLVARVETEELARGMAHQILASLQAPYALAGKRVTVAASVGMALYPRDGRSAEALLAAADAAMYRRKRAGGNAAGF